MDRVTTPHFTSSPTSSRDNQKSVTNLAIEKRLIAELILLRVPQFGPAAYWALHEHFGNAENILNADLNECRGAIRKTSVETLLVLQNCFHSKQSHPIIEQAESDLNYLRENKMEAIAFDDERYPVLLKTTHNPPPVLFVQGELKNLYLPQLAIVGSRNPSPSGRDNALHFAQQLAAMGFVITSGLALGVDAAAHQGALKSLNLSGIGSTLAVMGTGIDQTYPRSHQTLRQQILDNNGTVVTEFSPGVGPQASHFPRRNRIIRGMSLGVLVVEAAIKSGSLITARYALQQNREVFAIPGSIHNPLSRGCHALLREGASLVESIDDMREPLNGLLEFKWRELSASQAEQKNKNTVNNDRNKNQNLNLNIQNLSADEEQVYEQVDFDLSQIDVLEQRTQLAPGSLLSALMSLELKGLIVQSAGAYQRVPAKTP